MLHVASAASTASTPAVAAIVPFALAVAIRRAAVSHCEGLGRCARFLLVERKKSIGEERCYAAAAAGEKNVGELRLRNISQATGTACSSAAGTRSHRPRLSDVIDGGLNHVCLSLLLYTTALSRQLARGQP